MLLQEVTRGEVRGGLGCLGGLDSLSMCTVWWWSHLSCFSFLLLFACVILLQWMRSTWELCFSMFRSNLRPLHFLTESMKRFFFGFICDLTSLSRPWRNHKRPQRKRWDEGKFQERKKVEVGKNAPKPLPNAVRDRELVNLRALDIAQSSVLREDFYLWHYLILRQLQERNICPGVSINLFWIL